jgi:hypothetical protein
MKLLFVSLQTLAGSETLYPNSLRGPLIVMAETILSHLRGTHLLT